MIFLAVFSNLVALYSNAEALFRKHVDPHQWVMCCLFYR